MNIIFCISFILGNIVLSAILYFVGRVNEKYTTNMSKNNFVGKYPKIVSIFLFIAYLIFCLFVILMSTVLYNETATLWVYIIFITFALSSLTAFYATLRIKIIIQGNEILYYPAFAKKRKMTFNDITSVKYCNNWITCYNNNKRIFRFEFIMSGYDLFLSRVKSKPTYCK